MPWGQVAIDLVHVGVVVRRLVVAFTTGVTAGLDLTPADRSMLAGKKGEGVAQAMRIICAVAGL